MNYILHFFFTIQLNIGFRNKRNAYINPFSVEYFNEVIAIAKHVVMNTSWKLNMENDIKHPY